MPDAPEILQALRLAANQAIAVAVVWHAIVLGAMFALVAGWMPTRRVAGFSLAAPLASAGIVGFLSGSPFNGIVLSVLALTLLLIAWRFGEQPVQLGGPGAILAGALLLGFGWVYPHFLESRPAVIYLVAAPVGVVPCPTLSLLIGVALLGGGLGSRAFSLTLAAVGLFYGLFGAIRLGVTIDAVLVAGAAVLLCLSLRRSRRVAPPSTAKPAPYGVT